MKEGRKIKIKEVVTKFLEKRKGEIEEKEFFPSVDNVIHGLKDFFLDDLNTETIAEYIRKWIKENKILGADGLMELKKKFELPLYEGSSRSHTSSTRLSEKDIKNLTKKWHLELLSNYYDDYENKYSILKFKCKKCGNEFEDSLNRIERRIFPCPKEYEDEYKKRRSSERKKESFDLEKIREMIKQINWGKLTYKYRKNQNSPSIEIALDPYSDCSHTNPLYRNKSWLVRLYTDKNLNLSDKKLAKICGIDVSNITKWRKKHNIPAKGRDFIGKWIEKKSGYVRMYMPKDYLHPQQKRYINRERRNSRFEHDVIMEQYLAKHPELVQKKFGIFKEDCLLRGINGKLYLNNNCPVHHINYIPYDNILKNFWLYESKEIHNSIEVGLYDCLSSLIKLGQIVFENGKYFFNKHFNYKTLSKKDINELLNRKKTVKDYRFIMEQYLSENPELEISKNYLDSNGKLKSSCRIHHINLHHEDNRLCNLWICEDISKHRQIHSSLTSLVSPLLKSGFIIFKEGKYYLN